MKAKNEIERWLKDEKFMAFANKRAKEEFFNSENNYIDPQYEEMAEGFEDNDEYVVPMVDYLSYRFVPKSTEIDGDVNVTSGGCGSN